MKPKDKKNTLSTTRKYSEESNKQTHIFIEKKASFTHTVKQWSQLSSASDTNILSDEHMLYEHGWQLEILPFGDFHDSEFLGVRLTKTSGKSPALVKYRLILKNHI